MANTLKIALLILIASFGTLTSVPVYARGSSGGHFHGGSSGHRR